MSKQKTDNINLLEPYEQNREVLNNIKDFISNQFPVVGKKNTLELIEISADPDSVNETDAPAQKDIKLKGKTWSLPIFGHMRLINNNTGKVIDESKNVRLANIPTLTNRYSMIVDGSEYQTINQLRLKSGIYTRTKENGELESWFDLEKGYNFKMIFDPETKLFYLTLANRKFRLYPILRALAYPEENMKKAWGSDIFDENKKSGLNREDKEIRGLVEKLTRRPPKDFDSAVDQLKEYLSSTKVNPMTTKITLGEEHSKVNAETLFATSKKILGVLRGEQKEDERDSLIFKNLLTPPDLLSAYLDKQKKGITMGLSSRTDSKEKIRDIISSETYTSPIKKFYTTVDLSSTPEQTNPVSILGEWRKTTVMGTGGVQSSHAITMGVRDVHPSHMGFLDPINTPECMPKSMNINTLDGWKNVDKITLQDKVACNIDGKLHYLHPQKVQEFDYEGQLYTFENRKIKQVVTHNHRMWVRPIDMRSNLGYRIESAEEMYGKSRLIKLDHIAYEGNPAYKEFVLSSGRKLNIVDWCSLVGWQLSEGSVRKYTYGPKQPYALAIAQTTPKNLPIIEKLLNRLNLNFKYVEQEFAVYDKELAEYFSQFGYCHEKYIPEDLFETPVEAREALLDALMKGDGRRTDPRNPLKAKRMECETYTTTSKRLAEDVERLMISLGLAPSIKCYQDEREDRYLDIYEVRILGKSDTQLLPKKGHHSRKDYKGKVYGITVPGGLLYVKEEGYIPSWTGNSGKVGVTLPLPADVEKGRTDIEKQVIMPDGSRKKITPLKAVTMTIAFPDQWEMKNGKPVAKKPLIKAMSGGSVKEVKPSEVDAWMESSWSLFSWPTNLIPFIQSNDAVRASFGSKMTGQALPLVNKESPLVESKITGVSEDITFEKAVARYLSPSLPPGVSKAKVTKITDDYVHLKADGSNKTIKVGLFNNFPLNRETFLDSKPVVKVGDEVTSKSPILAHTNFQDDKDGSLALGLNVNVAYMPWKGLNYEDSAVITESLANKFTSSKIVTESLVTHKDGILNLQKFRVNYPTAMTDADSKKYDEDGVIKEGSWVDPDGILVAYLEAKDMTDTDRILKSMNKSVYVPYSNRSLYWRGHERAQVVYVNKLSGGKIQIHLKSSSPMVVGDKIAGRHGNKSIVSRIIPDDEAPHTKDGDRIDLILSPNGVPGRMNAGQLLETAAGKVAKKTGKKFYIENFSGKNYLKDIQNKLKENGLQADDVLLDGKGGKPFTNPIFNGNQYIMKLMHTVDHKAKARSYGTYSIDEQPVRGKEGGQKVDPLSSFALLSHGAKENLKEFAGLKSQQNDEVWAAIQSGRPIPPPQTNFAFEKLLGHLKGVGVNVNKKGHMLELEPMTDEEVLAMSSGKLEDAGHMLVGKNLSAIKGGLFDKTITGGMKGKKWSHIELTEKMPHPLYEKPIMSLLGVTKPQFDGLLQETFKLPNGKTGTQGIEETLRSINIDDEIKSTKAALAKAAPTDINKLNKKTRYLLALKKFDKNPADVYMVKNFPVMPPAYRPTFALPSGDLNSAPINYNYRDLALVNKSLKDYKDSGLMSAFGPAAKTSLYKELTYTVGTAEDTRPDKSKKEGVLVAIAGNKSPKFGMAHSKLWGKRQDLSARSTITLDPQLGLDEIGLPETLYKKIFLPFAVQQLVRQGYTPLEAREEVRRDSDVSKRAFDVVMQNRPVLMNRAPSLHKHSVQAHIAKPIAGSSIKLNPLIVKGYGADFDGDLQIGSVFIFILDKHLDMYYNISNRDQAWFNIRKVSKEMSSRFGVDLPYLHEGEFYVVNLEDFPYNKDALIGTKDHIDFYEALPHTKVVAYDEALDKLVLADVSGWSVHKDREVWTVTLHNKKQIITDDDERAVYGILPKTLDIARRRPSESIGMLVPYAKNIEKCCTTSFFNFVGTGKLKEKIPADKKVGYVIGALAGDGWVDKVGNKFKAVNLSGTEKCVTGRYIEYLDEIFIDSPHIGHNISENSYGASEKWIVNSTDFAGWIYPLIGKGAQNKHLPPCWFSASREFKLGLLSGLLDTDGSICITHGKSKPQLQANISSASLRLLQESQQLLRTLGVTSRISYSKKTTAGKDFWILSISSVDLVKLKDELNIAHEKNVEAFSGTEPNENSPSYQKTDLVPISEEIATLLMKAVGHKENRTLYLTLAKARKEGFCTRSCALRSYALRGEAVLEQRWVDIIHNKEVSWSYVTEVENTGKTETGYDLTVPGHETFMSVDGIILSNTMSVHVPVGNAAVEEAYTMLPSKNVWQPGSKNNVPAGAFAKDYMLGLWHLTRERKSTNYNVKNIAEANKLNAAGKIGLNDTLTIAGKKTSLGRQMVINSLPKSMRANYDKEITKKELNSMLNDTATNHSKEFSQTIDALKDLALQFGHSFGSTISINDLDIDRSYRDNIVNKFKLEENAKWSNEQKATHWLKAQKQIEAAQDNYIKKTNKARGFYDMLESGSEGKHDSVRQLISMPGVKIDVHGKALPMPITKSYAEGLDQGEYWMSLYGARKGMVDRAINTEQSGAINKALLGVTKSLLVVEADCRTTDGVEIDVMDSRNLMDRFLAKTVPGVGKAGEEITSVLLTKARSKKLKSLEVRSPLTCEAINGVCQKCYGIAEDGNLVAIGTNIGVKEGQSVTERSTQLTMKCTVDSFTIDGSGSFTTLEQCFTESHAPSDTLKVIYLKDGGCMIVQANHPMWVNGEEKQAKDIVVGKDTLEVSLQSIIDIYNSTEKDNSIAAAPGYWMGAFAGDGCFRYYANRPSVARACNIANIDMRIKEKLASQVDGIIKDKYYQVHNTKFSTLVSEQIQAKAKYKKLRLDWARLDKEWLAEFISGLIDTDGSKDRTGFKIYSNSFALLDQVRVMCAVLGIPATLRLEKRRDINNSQPFSLKLRDSEGINTWLNGRSIKVSTQWTPGKLRMKPIQPGCSEVVVARMFDLPIQSDIEMVYDRVTPDKRFITGTYINHNSFHSGGSAAAEQDVVAGFPRMEQVLKVPEIVAGKAVLAAIGGIVHRIEKSSIGGNDVYIAGVKHHVPFGRKILVKNGDKVLEGDQISSGSIKPQELMKYKGYQAARLQMVNDLEGVFGKEGLGKKTFETVIRGIANQAIVTDAKDSEYLRGDAVSLTKIKADNKDRAARGMEQITYEPYFKSIDTLAMDNPDWLSKLTVNRIRDTLKDGASLGAASNLHGTDPMPSYLYGTEFGKGKFY